MKELTISIVTANNKKIILDCLRSIYGTAKGLKLEVYVVINNSSDDSEAAIKKNFPNVKLIINQKKLGFTHNHNTVIKKAKGKYILVLNDDTVILDGALEKMVEYMEAFPSVGILGCKILNSDGSLQWSCGKSFNHKFEYFKAGVLISILPFLQKQNIKNTKGVSWVTGACLLVRSEAVRDVGLFDEKIIIYYEDGDWCYRMIQAGWKVIFYPQAEIIHYHGQTRKKHLARDTFIIYLSRLYFFSKHYSYITQQLVRLFTITEVIVRYMKTLLFSYALAGQRDQRDELLGAYRLVIRLAMTKNSLLNGVMYKDIV